MNSPSISPTSPGATIITLDDSIEDDGQNDSVINLSSAETTFVHFDGTLPPGETPDGFMLVDEDVDCSEIQTCKDDSTKEQPLFKVLFKDVSTFSQYYKKIENFLKLLIQSNNNSKNLKSSTKDLVLEIFDSNDSSENLLSNKLADQLGKQSNDVLFTIDTKPKLKDDLDIPMYGKKFNKALQAHQKKDDPDDASNQNSAPKMTCFNCLGNHSLRDCSKPRNYTVINKNRKEHVLKRGSTSVRYHLDDDQKFGHFIPGQISLNLRRALGIKENELPSHIYKMRVLGYPPGWLEEARLQHSGLALFNSDGHADVGSDEEGEIISPGDKDKYDIKKIIDFPGFNVLPPKGTREKCDQYWGSFAQEQHSKSTMLSYLSNKKADDGYKRKKLLNFTSKKITSDLNSGEMDIDEVEDTAVECVPVENLFIPPLPKDDKMELPPLPPPLSVTEDSDSQSQENLSTNDGSPAPSSRDGSPSLYDLECTKKQLLAELDNSSSQSNLQSTNTDVAKSVFQNVEVSGSDSSEIVVPDLESLKTEEHDSSRSNVNINNSTPKNSPKSQSSSGSGCKSVLSKYLGTPILKSTSPFRRLPSSEKFSKDICDVINFENLPDATGKYDQMSELLQKVRNRVTELQKEN